MTWDVTRDTLHRTVKLLVDSGKARTPQEARAFLESRVLQVAVGPHIGSDPAAQAALLTIVNAGCRAFLGGVHVVLAQDARLDVPWAAGLSAAEAVARFGGTVVDQFDATRPTLAVARAEEAIGTPLLHVTCDGWAGGVVEDPSHLLDGGGVTPAGIAAGALGVSEAFQRELGDSVPGRRDVGISLWRPDLDWRDPEAVGPELHYLPAGVWLFGIGHLGQAYAWVLGMLPYGSPAEMCVGLVDFDHVVKGNVATQLLVDARHIGQRKTRVVAAALESVGFDTTIVERAFDNTFRPDIRRHEPRLALAGFDGRDPRLLLADGRFAWVVDGGLGRGPVDYLDIVVNTFPSPEDPADAFPPERTQGVPLTDAYTAEIARQVADGGDEAAVRCGMVSIAEVTVGAAFVGAFAATIVIADVLRLLHGGRSFSVVHVDLRHPGGLAAIPNAAPSTPTPAFARAHH